MKVWLILICIAFAICCIAIWLCDNEKKKSKIANVAVALVILFFVSAAIGLFKSCSDEINKPLQQRRREFYEKRPYTGHKHKIQQIIISVEK